MTIALKTCRGCGALKEATTENFDHQKLGLHGFRSRCKPCRVADEAAYRTSYRLRSEVKQRRREARRDPAVRAAELAYNREWISKTGRGRLTQFLGHCRSKEPYCLLPIDFGLRDYATTRQVFGDECPYCETASATEFDHFIPVSSADCPGTLPGNIVPVCRGCNASKRDRPALAFLGIERFAKVVTRLSQCLR